MTINLEWQTFNVDLNTVDAWIKANAAANYCGMSANSELQIHYTEQPDDSVISAVQAYWAGLNDSSPEATNYKPESQRMSESASAKATALASATSKLEALGLTQNEIDALLGQ